MAKKLRKLALSGLAVAVLAGGFLGSKFLSRERGNYVEGGNIATRTFTRRLEKTSTQEAPKQEEKLEEKVELSPINWNVPWPDMSKPNAGYPILGSVEHFEVFNTTPDMGVYNHGAGIVYHNNTFFVRWSNQKYGEGGPGMRTLCSISKDGKTWKEAFELFPSLDKVRPAEESGRILISREWVTLGNDIYAIDEAQDMDGWSNQEQTKFSENKTKEINTRVRKRCGTLARKVKENGELGPIFWLEEKAPEPVEGQEQFPDMQNSEFRDIAQKIKETRTSPFYISGLDFMLNEPPENIASDGHRLSEPTVYRKPDGNLVRLARDEYLSHRIYASISYDEGKNWEIAQPTNIPDSPSNRAVGNLPNGLIYLIGNQVSEPFDKAKTVVHYRRDPLVISTSRDGITFDWAASIRTGKPETRYPGLHKGPGFQYPSAVVVEDKLWVVYSINKEDISISSIPLSSLDRQ